jgi:histidinol-phosphate aminotransferase
MVNDDVLIEPRKEVSGFEPYVPGRDMENVRRLYKLKRVIKLASNENPIGPSPRAVAALRGTVNNCIPVSRRVQHPLSVTGAGRSPRASR